MKTLADSSYLRSLCGLICIVVSIASVKAQTSGRPDGLRFVPDVEGQFLALANRRADPFGLRIGGSPNPSHCKHYQSITRVNGQDGTPFFLMTRSGNFPGGVPIDVCNDSPGETGNGHLIVFRMGSRDKNGERLRSNRFLKNSHLDETVPPPNDIATVYYTVVGGDPNDPDPAKRPGLVLGDGPSGGLVNRAYQHPGGMQLLGNVLALSLEAPRNPLSDCLSSCVLSPVPQACQKCVEDFGDYQVAPHPTLIMFFDVSDPESPRFLNQFAPHHPEGDAFQGAGVVGVTPLPAAPGENFERYLMAITGGDSDVVHFFRSNLGDLTSTDLSWEFIDKAFVSEKEAQTMNFVRQGDINGPLYIAAVRGDGKPDILFGGPDDDMLDLYDVICEDPYCRPVESEFGVTMPHALAPRHFVTFPNTGGNRLANGAAASGYYISPSGELILYVSEHDNDGPNGTVKAGEWRHREVVRPGSPTLLPTAVVNGPYTVDEGGSVNMNGTAEPPITKAFIQLFHSQNLVGFNLIADYDDRLKDDFDNLFLFEHQINPFPPPGTDPVFYHADKAQSLSWFAPPGCRIRATDFGDGTSSDQPETLTLSGTGEPQSFTDLSQVLSDGTDSNINEEIDAVEFLGACDYSGSSFLLKWDLDLNGTFDEDEEGTTVSFSAALVDGPSIVNIPAQATYQSGGQRGTATAVVTVLNIAPSFSSFALTDSAGNAVNTLVPFVLTGRPVGIAAHFSDPGVLDHQSGSLDWGDGTVKTQSSLATFDEAFGDGAGSLSDGHIYAAAGVYAVNVVVTDDDGGIGSTVANLRVLTPEQAVAEMISTLNAALATCPNSAVCFDLQRAKVALAGSNPESVSGALKMIRAGDRPSARAFLSTAGTWLERAETDGGSGLDALQALVLEVAATL